MPHWIQWRLTASSQDAELCAQLLMDAGCDGVQIDDCAVLFDESEDAAIESKATAAIIGYTHGNNIEMCRISLEDSLSNAGVAFSLEVETIADEDWATSWRENFPPLHIGPFLIAPSWEEVQKAGDTPQEAGKAAPIVIRLDPGLAFGTGQHPTTRMCLELLPACLEMVKSSSGSTSETPRALDVGCGSGILSVALAKLGAGVVASDLDPQCTNATRENAAQNGVQFQVIEAAGLDWLEGKYSPFDLVIANLMSDLLIRLAPDLAKAIRPGGVLLVSGISAPRADEVEAAMHRHALRTMQRRVLDGEQRGDWIERWVAFVFEKQAA